MWQEVGRLSRTPDITGMWEGKKKMHYYQLARLKKYPTGWLIEYRQYDPLTNKVERIRKTYGLNRTKNKKERRARAKNIIEELNAKIPHGFPFSNREFAHKSKTPAHIAIQKAIGWITSRTRRKSTLDTMLPVIHRFLQYLQKNNLQDTPIATISSSIVLAHFEHYLNKNIAAITYNNYRTILKAMFKELKKREYISTNPVDAVTRLKQPNRKIRTFLNDNQKQKIFRYAVEHDTLLAICIILLYYCAIRPREQRRLRKQDINLKDGTIIIPSHKSKNWDDEIITIPEEIIPILKDLLQHADPNDFILGQKWGFNSEKACGKNTPNYRHRRAINILLKQGTLHTDKGISLYSWKDTAAMDLVGKMNVYDLMKHFRHKDLSYTQKYLDNLPRKNENVAKVKMGIHL